MDKGRVKQMTAREYLNYVRSIDNRLKIQEERIGQLEKDICSIQAFDYTKDKVTGTKVTDISDKIARLDELRQDANKKWNKLIEEREAARGIIEMMGNITEQRLLIGRYLRNKSWEQLCVEMEYSWRGIFKIHREALKNFGQHYKRVH